MSNERIIKAPWSNTDQLMLQELQARKAEWENTVKPPVEKVLNDLFNCLSYEDGFEYLTTNADVIRDALAPFDSGVRVKEMP